VLSEFGGQQCGRAFASERNLAMGRGMQWNEWVKLR
jgi:hypothetical protein